MTEHAEIAARVLPLDQRLANLQGHYDNGATELAMGRETWRLLLAEITRLEAENGAFRLALTTVMCETGTSTLAHHAARDALFPTPTPTATAREGGDHGDS